MNVYQIITYIFIGLTFFAFVKIVSLLTRLYLEQKAEKASTIAAATTIEEIALARNNRVPTSKELFRILSDVKREGTEAARIISCLSKATEWRSGYYKAIHATKTEFALKEKLANSPNSDALYLADDQWILLAGAPVFLYPNVLRRMSSDRVALFPFNLRQALNAFDIHGVPRHDKALAESLIEKVPQSELLYEMEPV